MKGTSSGRDAYLRHPKSRDVYWSAANGMLRNLLIASENGRVLTTYGVNRSGLYTMKFTFLACVILISGCVFVSGDLEIYPGVEQEDTFENREQPSNFFDRFYLDPRWRASIPWADQDQDYYKNNRYINAKLSERIRQLEDFVSRRRQQLKEEAEKNAYLNIRLPGSEEGEDYGKLSGKNYEHYQLKYPNQQILDDVRPYPHEENDFTFKDEEGEEKEKTLQSANMKTEKTPQFNFVKSTNEDDEFAYGPTDPRFYEDTPNYGAPRDIQEERLQRPIVKVISSTDGSGQIVLTQRNEAKFPLGQMGQYQLQKHDNTVEVVAVRPHMHEMESAGVYIIAIVAGISAAATVGLIAFAIGWYNLQKHVKNAADVEYPAYGVTGPNKEVSPSGDRRLAQSAQMYHYQHQKQQIIAMESRAAATERHGSISEADSDEENEEGDYTVYECPGLAPTGEMEVKNPLFQDDPTPAQTPQVKQNDDGNVQKK